VHGIVEITFLSLGCIQNERSISFAQEPFSYGASQKGVLWPFPTKRGGIEDIDVKVGEPVGLTLFSSE
jgi:hypothetical protein